MHRSRHAASGRRPGDGPIQRVVDLEDAGSVSEVLERAPVAPRKSVTDDPGKSARCDIEKHDLGVAHVGQPAHPRPARHLPAEPFQLSYERINNLRAPAAHDRPSGRVRERREQQCERCRQGLIEREHRVRSDACNESAPLVGREPLCKMASGTETERAKARHRQRMRRRFADRCEHRRQELDRGGAPSTKRVAGTDHDPRRAIPQCRRRSPAPRQPVHRRADGRPQPRAPRVRRRVPASPRHGRTATRPIAHALPSRGRERSPVRSPRRCDTHHRASTTPRGPRRPGRVGRARSPPRARSGRIRRRPPGSASFRCFA